MGEQRRRKRVFVRAPAEVLTVTAGIADREITTFSQGATALQFLGLAHLIILHRTLHFLFHWRQPTHHPRIPFRLGFPQPWLDFIAGLRGATDFRSPGRGGVPLIQTDHPRIFPPLERVHYDTLVAWHQGARQAATLLQVPMDRVLGLLQAVGIIVYASEMKSADVFFGEHAREYARNNRDLFNLRPLWEWAPLAGYLLPEAIRASAPDEHLTRMAKALVLGEVGLARKSLQERRAFQTFSFRRS